MSVPIVRILFLLAAAAATAHAADPVSAGQATTTLPTVTAASDATEQRLRQDVQLMLSRLAASGALGQHPDQITLRLDEPAQRVTNLGILVDSTSAERARDGLRVLGSTPGSTGEHLGLLPGDVIVAVNNTSLRSLGADADGRALAAATLKSTVEALPDASPLRLDVLRDGEALAMNAPLQSVILPALRMELGRGHDGQCRFRSGFPNFCGRRLWPDQYVRRCLARRPSVPRAHPVARWRDSRPERR